MFFRSYRVRKKFKALSETYDIPYRNEASLVWYDKSHKCVIIDCPGFYIHNRDIVISKITNLLSKSHSSYLIILADMDKTSHLDLSKILDTFPDTVNKNTIKIYNHNVRIDAIRLTQELCNTKIQRAPYNGPISKYFICYLRYLSQENIPQKPLENYRPDGTSMCGANNDSYHFLLFTLLSV